MVVSKDAKRKQRKEDTPPLVTSPVNVPKRTKVQAQRKFAQGQGTSSTSYTSVGAATSSAAAAAAAAGTSNPATPVKDNRDPPPELFTHKRPKTEDFLTYLCFRGTSVLPSHLDFLNQNSNNKTTPGKEEETVTKSTPDNKKQKDDTNSKSDATTSKVDPKPKSDEVNSTEKPTAKKEDKPEIMPFAVRKRADQVVEGNRRLRNTLDKNTKLRDRSTKKEDSNRRSPRTRSKIEDEPQDEENVTEPMETEEENHINEPPKKEKVEEEKTPVNKNKRKGNIKSATKESEQTKNIVEEIPEVVVKPPAAVKTKTPAPMSPPPPPVEETPVKEKTPLDEKAKSSAKGKAKKESTPAEPVGRMTRQRAFFEPVKLPYKDPDTHEKEEKSEPVEQESPKVDKKSEFSSDDEQPLAKAIKLARKASKKGPKKGKKKAATPVEEEQPKEEIRSPTPEVQSNKSAPIPVTPAPGAGNRRKLVRSSKSKTPVEARAESAASHKSDVSSKKSVKETKKVPIKRKKGVGKSDEDESESNAPPKTKVEKKMPESNHLSSPPPAEASEGEVKSGRPMRKTKEAATIYMELIGQKLNLGEFDDEGESIDSFPELPNAKKTQQREKEMKQNVGRPKGRKNNRKRQKAVDDVEAKTVEQEKAGEEIKIDEKKIVQKKKGKTLTGGGEKLEKSFSDSDDEPLATKLVKPAESCKPEKRPSPRKSTDKSEKLDVAAKQDATTTIDGKKVPQATPLALIKEIPKASIPETKILPKSPPTSPPHKGSPANQKDASVATGTGKQVSPAAAGFPALDRFPSPKINPTFLTPKFDRTIERRIPIDPSPPPLSSLSKTHMPPMSPKPSDALNLTTTSPSGATTSKKFEPDTFLSANLMPSKEESGKIFGIASVSLAQSSGPDNTKCTLGKCGSIHKPVLGPVVPTEAYLGEQLSSKERRKAKVNMTHEQIQKWLIECSSNPDEIQDDLDDDFDDHLKPMTFAPSPTLARDEKDSTSPSTSSKLGKDSVKVESVWSGKGPSLKATPVVMKDDIKPPPPVATPATKTTPPAEPTKLTRATKAAVAKSEAKTEVKDAPVEKPKSITPIKSVRDRMKSPKPSTSSTPSPKHLRATQPSKIEPKATSAKATPVKTTPAKTTPAKTTPVKTTPVKTTPVKTIKRQTVYSSKLSDASKRKPMTNNFAAFSPENETSVYSFDKEDDVLPPTAKPFRRHSRRESAHEETSQGDKSLKIAAEKTPVKEAQQNNSVSVTLSPDENSKSIKVSLDNAEKSPPAKKGKVADKPATNDASAMGDSDSEGHTFYIPLQGIGPANTSSGKSSDVIQGVAVKLGREGPDGPNQRVIMHATLVTKAQMGTNPTPIPDSMNVHEIVKSLLSSNKDSSTSNASKSVPVGTVQPRFKSTSNNTQQQQPSTAAAAAADQQNPSGSGLTRVNSNSSLFSGSNKSRAASATAKKPKDDNPIKMCNNTAFPHRDDPTQMVEAPIFRPTEKEFQDPIDFIDRITPIAARFGICKIIPPESFKPECRISDDMRFTAYNQYVHKMLHRWGPSAKELSAIKKYLATQSIAMTHPPWIGGMEVDLPRLYHTVQELGGLKEVIEKKKWARVAEEMCIPKLAQDRVTKLDDIYCKYLLPYDTLSPAERQKLFDEVEADWAKREARARRNADRCINPESVSNEDDEVSSEDDEDSDEEVDGVSMECIVKGRSMPLNAFFRIARNTMALWFKNTEPTVADIEAEFWRHVAVRDSHVCVHSGSIDSSGWGYGFPTPGPKTKASPCARHPWNLKVLTNNPGSVLRSLGPVTGVTVPTLHVGMLFSACCWYRDPHGLSWIEYLHTGASKIWYGIPDEQSSSFRTALTALIPTHCQNKTIWLPCDTAMVPPHMLTDRGVSLCRIEQKPGEFVVIFPRAYTSSVATGYEVSESVYFATSSWLDLAKDDFKDIHESCEPAMFSLEQLLFALASDQRVTIEILSQILPMLTEVYDKEVAARQQLKAAGVISTEKLLPNSAKSKQKSQQSEERECDLCRANLYISMIKTDEGNIYCLQHALKNINNGNVQAKQCKLIFTYNIEDVENILKNLRERLTQMPKKKAAAGSSGRKNSQSK